MLIKKIVLMGLLFVVCIASIGLTYGIFHLLESYVPQLYIQDAGPDKILDIVAKLPGYPFWLFTINTVRSLAIMIVPTVVGVKLIKESQELIDFYKQAPKYPPIVYTWGLIAFGIAIIQSLNLHFLELLQIDSLQEIFVFISVATYALYIFMFQARRAWSNTTIL